MNFQEYIIDSILRGYKDAFKAAKAVPEDKLTWKPLDLGRSVLDQLQELAQAPGYATPMVTGEAKAEGGEDQWTELVKERQAWTTIDACEAEANRRLDELFKAIRNCTDERMKETVWLPYDGGRDFTISEIMEYPRWNANYHEGQIAYIQTLYGDKDMH